MSAPGKKIVNAPRTAPGPVAAAAVMARAPMGVQRANALRLSSPPDAAEVEAETTARRIVRMPAPAASLPALHAVPAAAPQRSADTGSRVPAPTATEIGSATGSGSPLPAEVRAFMEPRFGADFGGVRIHTGDGAARLSRQLNAHAFTVGQEVFFGRDRFQPHSTEGRELIAHELTHTIQQGAAVQRAEIPISERTPLGVQRLGIGDALDFIADKANYIPGFRMLTVVLGVNPVSMSRVERSAANVLRAIVEFMPGGAAVTQVLDSLGVAEKAGAWVEQQLRTLGMTGRMFRDALDRFLDSLSWRDIFRLGSVWDRAKAIFTEPVGRLIAFVKGLITGILALVRDGALRPLASLAEGTAGYALLKAVLGRDPITGDPVPRNADTLIGGFMRMIGQEEVWQNLQRANAVPRAFAWFQGALSGLTGFVTRIPGIFLEALRSLEILDFLILPRAFLKVVGAFAGVAAQFISWAGAQVLSLLEIIFDVLAPSVMPYLRKAAAAFRTIVSNPVAFVGNLVRAAKQGFLQFAGNFLAHLKASIVRWLTGTLSGVNVYIPQSFSLREILKFVLSVLGLTWQNVRAKLVKVVGERPVQLLEAGFDVVVTLVKEGPAAAWQRIQEGIANLRELVMEQVMTFVRDRIVQAAITKLLTSLNPAGAFIQAVLAVYNTVMFFVERLKQIAQVAAAFIDSIAAIASGAIGAAANRVEQTMAGFLTLVISFLARQAGLGRVSDDVVSIVNRVRAPIDRALDRVVDWIVASARKLGKLVAEKSKALFSWAFVRRDFTDGKGVKHQLYIGESLVLMVASTPQAASDFVDTYVRHKDDKLGLAPKIRPLIQKADKLSAEIEKVVATTPEGVIPAPEKQKELLGLSLRICELLTQLVAGDRKIGATLAKYKLEGQVGTYATVPKPVGDQLTPDHQPQASVIMGAADFFANRFNKEIGEKLADRARARAAKGYAINLHFVRHVAGATYGSKGMKRDEFRAELADSVKGMGEQEVKAQTSRKLRALLERDVQVMKEVVQRDVTDPAWRDIVAEVADKDERAKLKKQITDQVISGENQIASQPLDF